MTLSVLGTGSHTVQLAVCDARGAVPLPVHSAKWKLRLSEHGDSLRAASGRRPLSA